MTINLKKIIPFLDDDDLKELIEKILASDNQEYNGISIEELLPFLDEEDVDKMLLNYSDNEKNYRMILPFASEEKIGELFLKRIEQKKPIKDLLPFVNDSTLHDLVVKLLNGQEMEVDFDDIYPFLDDEDIKLVFSHLMGKTK